MTEISYVGTPPEELFFEATDWLREELLRSRICLARRTMDWSAVRIVISTRAIPDDQEPCPVEEAPVLVKEETPLADDWSACSS